MAVVGRAALLRAVDASCVNTCACISTIQDAIVAFSNTVEEPPVLTHAFVSSCVDTLLASVETAVASLNSATRAVQAQLDSADEDEGSGDGDGDAGELRLQVARLTSRAELLAQREALAVARAARAEEATAAAQERAMAAEVALARESGAAAAALAVERERAERAEAALLEARRKAVRRGEHKPQVPSLLEVATTLKLTV